MKHLLLGALALGLSLCAPARAQTASSVEFPAGYAPGMAPCSREFPLPGATKGRCSPVGVSHPLPVTMSVPMEERCAREGEPYSIFGNAQAVVTAAGSVNQTIVSTSAPPTIGKVFYLRQIQAAIDLRGTLQVIINGDGSSRFSSPTYQSVVGATNGGLFTIEPSSFVRAYQVNNGGIILSIRYNPTGGSANYSGSIAAAGCKLTDDTNYGARFIIEGFGDSTWNGTGPTATANMLPFLIRDYYRNQGIDARLVLKSVSGSTSSDHELWRKAGFWDVIGTPSLGLYALGINDAGAGTSAATYLANITAAWTYWHALYPTKHFVIFGVGPLENSTSETAAATLRTTASTYVSGVCTGTQVPTPPPPATCYLHYINLGAAFDRTVSTNYVGTDPAGSRVHPNDTGHAAEYTVVAAQLAAQGITIQ